MSRIHVIGAGMAGLATALRLRHVGSRVTVYEAAPRAGGRCRSFVDPQLGTVIDNGNHLLLSGNHAAMAYLRACGASDRVSGPTVADFPFVDVATGERWNVRPGKGAIPWWVLDRQRRVPGTTIADYWSVLKLLRASSTATVADCVVPGGVLYRKFWEPLTLAVLNATPAEGSADLMRAVLLETVAKGADACRPLIARTSLADALVDPAIAVLEKAGVQLRFSTRVRGIVFSDGAVHALAVDDGQTDIQRDDLVVLAVPAWVAETLVSGLKVPPPGEAIVNVHYRMPMPHTGEAQIIGVVGGLSQWVFLRGETASVTISAAGPVEDMSAEDITAKCWPEVALALGQGAGPMPQARVVKERRATPAQTPAAVALRPQVTTAYDNLLLAGDWTATGLPATIEAAIRSGFKAADVVSQRLGAADS